MAVWSGAPGDDARTVRGNEPTAAFAPTVSVSVLVVDPSGIALGENAAVTLAGKPSTANVTFPVAPLARVTVMGKVAEPPCTALAVPEPADTVMAGAGMVSACATVLSVTPLPVARNVRVTLPGAAVDATLIVPVLFNVGPSMTVVRTAP